MKNNKLTKFEKIVNQIVDCDEYERQSVIKSFYNDAGIVNFSYSSEKEPLAPLLEIAKAEPAPNTFTQEQLGDICQQIRDNIKQGKPNNVEIQFHKGRQVSDRQISPLGTTVVKLTPMDDCRPKYFFISKDDILNASVFLGGENASGIMAMPDKNGNNHFLRLSEFHMLSLWTEPDSHKEIGLMTSYIWMIAKVYSSTIHSYNLNPVKNLLLAGWLQEEWQHAKDNSSKLSNEVIEGEVNA